jgi:hypothetical protein
MYREEVVHHYDLPSLQSGAQEVFDVDQESLLPVCCALYVLIEASIPPEEIEEISVTFLCHILWIRRVLLKAKVHAANVFDRDRIKLLFLEDAKQLFSRLSHLWLDAGYDGKEKGKDWVEKVLGSMGRR